MNSSRSGSLAAREPAIITALRDKRMHDQIAMALPKQLTPERFIRMMITCIRQTPKLALCDQRSVLSAMFELAQLGLEPNTPLGQAWIVPFETTAQIIVGYKGFVNLAYRSGVMINAEYVFDGDLEPPGLWEYALGTDPYIRHRRNPDPAKRTTLIAAYSVAREPNGRVSFKVVDRGDIEYARSRSQAYQAGLRDKSKRDSPWFTAEPQMWAKTAVRRHAPFLPLSAEFARALQLDALADAGQPQELTLPEGLLLELPAAEEAANLERALTAALPESESKSAGTS